MIVTLTTCVVLANIGGNTYETFDIVDNIKLTLNENTITVKGPKGTLTRQLAQEMTITQQKNLKLSVLRFYHQRQILFLRSMTLKDHSTAEWLSSMTD